MLISLILSFIVVIPLISVFVNMYGKTVKCQFIGSFLVLFNCFLSISLFFLYNFGHNFLLSDETNNNLLKNVVSNLFYNFEEYNSFFNWIFKQTNVYSILDVSLSTFTFGKWINSEFLLIDWVFSVNSLNSIMLIVVNLISALVHFYSLEYMKQDPKLSKFVAYLSLFTFFMILLITGDNFVILFLGWEGVGLCSYLLISFWNTRVQANKSAIKALVVNRVADLALTIGLLLIFYITSSLVFDVVFSLINEKEIFSFSILYNTETVYTNNYVVFWDIKLISIITILLFIGAMGKSAQIGLHTWLPDAMEGPTPVSALIHAATMVTAGVFLIIKCSPLFESVSITLVGIIFIGALTAFIASTVGLIQNDIKKVIAYSTCSQLGYMVFACGLSNYHVAFFHLVNHAFFKALLFLSAGAIIHSMSNEQDMRKYGSLFKIIPFTTIMLIIGSIALMGFPFLTGFYSKDLILEISFSKYTVAGFVSYILGLLAAFCTSFYSYRVFYLTYLSKNTTNKLIIQHTHELPPIMGIVLVVLSMGSLFFGYLTKELFVGLGSNFFIDDIVILPEHNNNLQAEFLPQLIKVLPLFLSMLAVISVNFLLLRTKVVFSTGRLIFNTTYKFLIFKWYFDWFYNKFINKLLLQASLWFFKIGDKQFLEWIGPFSLSKLAYFISDSLKKLQTGNMQHFSYLMLFSLFIFLVELGSVGLHF